jgi:hypothetical protein
MWETNNKAMLSNLVLFFLERKPSHDTTNDQEENFLIAKNKE